MFGLYKGRKEGWIYGRMEGNNGKHHDDHAALANLIYDEPSNFCGVSKYRHMRSLATNEQ